MYAFIPSFDGFSSYLDHHRALSSTPWAIQWVLISYLFYTQCQQCTYLSLSIHPTILPNFELSLFL